MRFKILYVAFILICILYPNIIIFGPISYRHIISLIMLVVCILEGFKPDVYLYLYYGFLLFLGISSIATGFSGVFFNKLFGTYIPIVAAYAATYLLIKKYDGTNIIVWTIVCVGVLNAIVTIGQFFDWSIADSICSILNVEIDEKYVNILDNKEDSEGTALPGLLGSVDNGYFLSATALLSLYNKNCKIPINLFVWLIIIAASFLAQERAGFILALFFSAFIVGDYFYSMKNKTAGLVLLVFVLIVCASVVYSYMDDIMSSELRYTKGFEGDDRSVLRSETWDYVLNNPMGGFYEFNSSGHQHPHNFLMNAFLFGGFLGGIILIALLFIQIIRIIPYVFRHLESKEAQWAFIWGLMYIDYSLNSMVHNASIVQGVMPFFIWWGAFIACADLNEEEMTVDY